MTKSATNLFQTGQIVFLRTGADRFTSTSATTASVEILLHGQIQKTDQN
jgi:hypothetical protein